MKKNLLTLILGLLIFSCSSTKMGIEKTKYFDENNLEISKLKFIRNLSTNNLLEIQGDSVNHKKLVLREKRGQINNREILESMLENAIMQELDPNKPIVIIYYPGKDPCNSSGTTDKERIRNWYAQLEEGLLQVAQVKPVYIYKENDGLTKYDGILEWKKDPDGIVEKMFFEHHYPCSSFAVISKSGEYISYFGEFGKEYVWEAAQIMNKVMWQKIVGGN